MQNLEKVIYKEFLTSLMTMQAGAILGTLQFLTQGSAPEKKKL